MKTHSHNTEFRDRLQYLKDTVDPQFLLESLGFKITNRNKHELRASCLIHGGDNSTAFRFNLQTKTWVCFSHKCHDVFGRDIIALIQAVKDCTFMEAVSFLSDITGGLVDFENKFVEYKYKKEREEHTANFGTHNYIPSFVDEKCLEQFKPFRSNRFIKDGYAVETLDYFEIAGGITDKEGYVRDIIPIRDTDGVLVAYSMRDIRDDVSDNDKKYQLTPGFNKDAVLYNLWAIKDLLHTKPLILVEGFKSVWRLYEYGIKNVVAIMGSSVTPGQMNLILSFAYNGCVLFFDNDVAGILGIAKAHEELKHKIKVIPQFILEVGENGDGLDPSDLTKEETINYLAGLY